MPTIGHQIKISAPPAAVYKSLTTVSDLQGWCASAVTHPTGAITVKQGETVNMHFGNNKDFGWKFERLEPNRHVDWRCVAGPDDAPGADVAFDLTETGDGRTCLSLEHKGWTEGHPEFVRCNTRWGALLGQLKHYVEQGTAQKAVK
jgi:uncharacterized protein YndB with AHSA1/START domain